MSDKTYTIPEAVSNELFIDLMEQEANYKKTKQTDIIARKQKQLENQQRISQLFPSFATSNKIEGYEAINLEIEKQKKSYHKLQDLLRTNLKSFFTNNGLKYIGDDWSGMLNYKSFDKALMNKWLSDTVTADLIDSWMESTEAVYYWMSKRVNDKGELDIDPERWKWTTDPADLYNKVLMNFELNPDGKEVFGWGVKDNRVISKLEHASDFLKNVKWEYVEKNSLIKEYTPGVIYSFKNGAFKYKGAFEGGATNPQNWERVKDQ